MKGNVGRMGKANKNGEVKAFSTFYCSCEIICFGKKGGHGQPVSPGGVGPD